MYYVKNEGYVAYHMLLLLLLLKKYFHFFNFIMIIALKE
jgi:hypothetical protein